MHFDDTNLNTDVLVVGGGLAGTVAALKAAEDGRQVLLVEKGKAGYCGASTFAAGMFSLFVPEEDDADAWLREVVEDGSYMTDQEWLHLLQERTIECVRELERWGVSFRKTPEGKLYRRPMRGGPQGSPMKMAMFGGPDMMRVLRRRAERSGVQLLDRVMITGLLQRDGAVTGAAGFHTTRGEFIAIQAKATVLASGGTGYKTLLANQKYATGDGTALGFEAGATARHCEFCSHQVSSPLMDIVGMNLFLAHDGRFVNALGEEFLLDYGAELGNKTLLWRKTQAMALEKLGGRGPIYFDMTHLASAEVASLQQAVPLTMRSFGKVGFVEGQRFVKKIEVCPTNEGTIASGGGLMVNLRCETTIPGLYAAGDTADRPVAAGGSHGTGALPFAAVSGAIAGLEAARYAGRVASPDLTSALGELRQMTFAPLDRKSGVEPDHLILSLQEIVNRWDIFIIQSDERLTQALADVKRLKAEAASEMRAYDPHYLRLAHETRQMLINAELWLQATLARKESRGPVFREDFVETDNEEWLKWITITKADGERRLEYQPIPFERYSLRPEKVKRLHRSWEVARQRGIEWA